MKTITRILLATFFLLLTLSTNVSAQTKIETPAERKARLEREAAEKKKKEQQELASRKKVEEERAQLFHELAENMVLVEGGTFMMGDIQGLGNAKPVHQVTLSSYYICKYEVTQELWQTVMGSNPSQIKGAKRPVEQVSWKECHQFIMRLNQLTGKQYRLPTEAEWEFAARGGNRSKGYQYAGSDSIGDVAWYGGNSNKQTHDVGMKLANELGLYDMSGNVSEFCEDWYAPYDSVPQTDPKGPPANDKRIRNTECCSHPVSRGGCWYNRPASSEWLSGGCEVWFRDAWHDHFGNESLGFRLVEKRQREEADHKELETLEQITHEQAEKEQAAQEEAERKSQEEDRKFRLNNCYNFSEGLAVYPNKKYEQHGYINETGDIVIPCTWYEANPFHEGLALVTNTFEKDYGYIDKTGKVVIPCTWKKAYAFSQEGLARVMDDNDRYGFINQAGEVVIPCTWWSAGTFSEDLAPVAENYHKWGFVDKTGKVVLPCIWGNVGNFSEGLAPVMSGSGGKWGFIDKTGNFVIPFGKMYDARGFKDGLAPVAKGGYYDKKWGIIDKTGKEVIKCKWSWIELPSEGLCVVKSGRKYGYVNEKGKLVIPCQWKNAYSFHNGVAEVEDENGNKHKIDKTGRIIE